MQKHFSIFILNSLILLNFCTSQVLSSTDIWLTYKNKGLQAQAAHDLTTADEYFQKALQEAESTRSDEKLIETLDHLVHVKILQGKMRAAQPFFEKAISVAQTLKDKPGIQKSVSMWMNDLGNFYFKIGEFSPNESVKEYCMEHYIDAKILGTDKYDPILVPRINLLTVKYYMQGQYAQAEQLKHKALIGIYRDPKKSSLHIATGEMANFLLLQKKFAEAQKYYRDALVLNNKIDPLNKVCHEGTLDRQLGTIEFEKQNWNAAEAYLIAATKLHLNSKADREIAFDSYVLGLIEDKKGNIPASTQYFQESLRLGKILSFPNPSLLAMSAEHLATELNKQHNESTAKVSVIYANTIRGEHPEWRQVSNPDPETFFLVSGELPFPTDTIPTRTHLDLY